MHAMMTIMTAAATIHMRMMTQIGVTEAPATGGSSTATDKNNFLALKQCITSLFCKSQSNNQKSLIYLCYFVENAMALAIQKVWLKII
jgi:hypothetical protein